MKNTNTPERFNRAIERLYNAYHNGTLAKGDCAACAVGNMCNNDDSWARLFMSAIPARDGAPRQIICEEGYIIQNNRLLGVYEISADRLGAAGPDLLNKAKQAIHGTGYSLLELAQVEKAFEFNTKVHAKNKEGFSRKEIKADQFNGLEAVIKVLCEIEGIENIMDYTKLFEIDENLSPVNELVLA